MAEHFGVNYFMARCLKLDHEMEAVMAIFDKMYKDMQKKSKQLIITCSSPLSLLSTPVLCVVLFDHHDIQTNTPRSRKKQHRNVHLY